MDPAPVFLTTYEMIIRDRVHLAPFEWRYIIVDEGSPLCDLVPCSALTNIYQ